MLQCPQCPRSAPSPQLLLAHLSHAHQLAFLCYLCLQPFSTLQQLVSSGSIVAGRKTDWKYTIRSIVCEAFSHPVIWSSVITSSSHLVIQSSGHPVI